MPFLLSPCDLVFVDYLGAIMHAYLLAHRSSLVFSLSIFRNTWSLMGTYSASATFDSKTSLAVGIHASMACSI